MTNLSREANEAERKYSRRLMDYREWRRHPRDLAPEDAGREIEFAWGDAWNLGYAAALSSKGSKG